MRKEFLGRGWKFPFQFDAASGGTALSEYEENIRDSITVILGTKKGERQKLPEFGCQIHEYMFAPNNRATSVFIAHHVEESLKRWEPRIEVSSVESWIEPGGAVRVQVHYTIKATRSQHEHSMLLTSGG